MSSRSVAQLVAGPSPRPAFHSTAVYVGFVMNKVPVGQVSVFHSQCYSTNSPHSFTHHRPYIISAIDCVRILWLVFFETLDESSYISFLW